MRKKLVLGALVFEILRCLFSNLVRESIFRVSFILYELPHIGSRSKVIHCVPDGCDHVLAGSATCPGTVDEAEELMARFISSRFRFSKVN